VVFQKPLEIVPHMKGLMVKKYLVGMIVAVFLHYVAKISVENTPFYIIRGPRV